MQLTPIVKFSSIPPNMIFNSSRRKIVLNPFFLLISWFRRVFTNHNFSKGPWGPWGQSGSSGDANSEKSGSSKNKGSNGQSENGSNQGSNQGDSKKPPFDQNKSPKKSNSEDFLAKIFEKIKKFLKDSQSQNGPSKSNIGIIFLFVTLFYLSLGFYKIDPNEKAVTMYFGKFYKISEPGLNYHIPFPFGQVIKKSVTNVNTEEFGFSSSSSAKDSSSRDLNAESIMLTGDENIVDIQFQVQWQISDISNYVFNIANPNLSIRKSAESAMREIIARTPIVHALSDGKMQIEHDAKILLQEMLDSYKSGIGVVLVQLRRVDPPKQVIDAFRDVQTAKADKEKEINEAQAYANDVIPRARGTASQMTEEAEAYAKQVVANSQGEASRFLAVYNEYIKAKQVTKRRIYLETMEKIYGDAEKIYIDKNVSRSALMPYFPLDEIKNSKSATKK